MARITAADEMRQLEQEAEVALPLHETLHRRPGEERAVNVNMKNKTV